MSNTKNTFRPTITIAIPARNETKELGQTLKKLLSLEYERLEIIVLDDCSQDQTSQIVKDFAHSGVRFVKGKVPPEPWLGKNFAIKQLVNQSSGAYLLITDADNPVTDELIELFLDNLKTNELESCVAVEGANTYLNFISQALFHPWPLTYYNDLFTGYRKNYKVDSWMVKKNALSNYLENLNPNDKYNEYKASPAFTMIMHDELTPTDGFDRSVIRQSSAENFLPTKYFSIKRNHDFYIRMLYPNHNHSFSKLFFSATINLVIFALIVSSLTLTMFNSSFSFAFFTFAILIFVFQFGAFQVFDDGLHPFSKKLSMLITRLVATPFIFLYSAWLCLESLYKYKRNKVEWRGRNVCFPIVKEV